MATRRKPQTPKAANRAALYVRVSTDQQAAEGLSLEAQSERLRAYCALRGLEAVELIHDPGESAGKPLDARPGGKRLLALLRSRTVDSVVVAKLDRAFRNVPDALSTVESWDKAGISLHLVDMGGQAIDTSTAIGRMFLVILAGLAEFERNQTAERTTAALAHKARSGNMRTNSTPPYGWRYEGNALVEAPVEQAARARLLELRRAGVSYRETIRILTAEGHRNRAGRPFNLTQIERISLGSVRQLHLPERAGSV